MVYLETQRQITSIDRLSHRPIISGVSILQETIFDGLQLVIFDIDYSTSFQSCQESSLESLSKEPLDCQLDPRVSNLTKQSRLSSFFHSQLTKGLL